MRSRCVRIVALAEKVDAWRCAMLEAVGTKELLDGLVSTLKQEKFDDFDDATTIAALRALLNKLIIVLKQYPTIEKRKDDESDDESDDIDSLDATIDVLCDELQSLSVNAARARCCRIVSINCRILRSALDKLKPLVFACQTDYRNDGDVRTVFSVKEANVDAATARLRALCGGALDQSVVIERMPDDTRMYCTFYYL